MALPTPRAQAAYRFLMTHNAFYRTFQGMQRDIIQRQASLNISSYDLFTQHHGIECAMFPVLYPLTEFTHTGSVKHYQDQHDDDSNGVHIGSVQTLLPGHYLSS